MDNQVLAGPASITVSDTDDTHSLEEITYRQARELLVKYLARQTDISTEKRRQILDAVKVLIQLTHGDQDAAFAYIARYRFGDVIVDKGRFTPPVDCACRTCEAARESVGTETPLMLILEGSAEVHVTPRDLRSAQIGLVPSARTAPLRMARTGEWLGVFEMLDRRQQIGSDTSAWSVSSGPRSIVLLHEFRGKTPENAFGFHGNVETSDAWKLIRFLARDVLKSPWRAELLLIPDSNLRLIATSDLMLALHEIGWSQSAHFRTLGQEDDDESQQFASFSKNASKKWRDTAQANVRHLVNVAKGLLPVLRPVAAMDIVDGPLLEVMNALLDVGTPWGSYVRYAPILLQADLLAQPGDVGFYSFRRPTIPVAVSSPEDKDFSDFISQTAKAPLYRMNDRWLSSVSNDPRKRVQFSRELRRLHIYRHRTSKDIDKRLVLSVEHFPAEELSATADRICWTHPWFTAVARIERA